MLAGVARPPWRICDLIPRCPGGLPLEVSEPLTRFRARNSTAPVVETASTHGNEHTGKTPQRARGAGVMLAGAGCSGSARPRRTFADDGVVHGQIPQESWVLRAAHAPAMQLHNPKFAELVHEVLWHTGLAPQRLELEITETALIRDLNRALATLRQLKALGVRIAMDDFGTGYSSLSNLRAFPFDKIKIDGSFIKSVDVNAQAATIVRAVLGLGRGLGLPVLAEGVETEGELTFLNEEFCNEAQGYLLGRPEPIQSFRTVTHGDVTSQPKPAAEVIALEPALRLRA